MVTHRMKQDILVVVDMQNDFIDGSLGTKEAEAIVGNVAALIAQYPKQNLYATKDTHTHTYLNTQEGKFLPVVHCVKDTDGWQFNNQLTALNEATIVEKNVFGSTHLVDLLKKRAETQPLSITLVGLCTDICVVSNAVILKNNLPETDIFVKADCCAGVTPETHEAALTTMKMCQIQII